MSTLRHTTCPLCEAMCGLRVRVEDNRVTEVRGDPDDPLSRGHLCPKAAALPDLHDDPDRLRHPVRRTADGWQKVSWDEALDDIAERIHRIQGEHGRDAVATYLGNPTVHNLGAMLFVPELVRAIRSRNRFSATSVDQLPQMLAAFLMFGHQLLIPIPDLDRTDLLVVFGANPLVSNGSLMSAPDIRNRLKAIQERGGKVVVIDPRRTETAKLADTHLFLRPGTDGLLLMALLHLVLAQTGGRLGPLNEHATGLADLRNATADFTPDVVAAATGVPEAEIRSLATALIDAKRAAVYGRMGVCTQRFGALNAWLITALNAVSGNLDREGGAMFTQPAFDALYPPGQKPRTGSFGRWRSRVRDLPEFGGELPVAALAEEILTPGEGRIRALITNAGNPVLSTPDGRGLDRAFEQLDLFVAIDFYIQASSRHAHYVLPPVSPLARPHYDVAFHALAIRNTARWSDPVLTDHPDLRHDWQIATDLARRLRRLRGASLTTRLEARALEGLGPERMIDLGLRLGAHGGLTGLSVKKLRAAPSGVDLGPLKPCLRERMPEGRTAVDLAPAELLADVPRLRALLDDPPTGLVLIGRRHLRSNNSWMHNSRRLTKGKHRCTLLVHPDDAAEHGLADGDEVRVVSRVGAVQIGVELSDAMMPGVVSLPHGWGHGRDGVQLSVAGEGPGVSVNDLTDPTDLDPVSGNAVLNGVPVTLEALA